VAADPNEKIIGQGWSFPPTFIKSNQGGGRMECGVEMVSGAEDVEQSLILLFGTSPGERPLHPRYGCDVKRFLFQAMDLTTVTEIQDTLSTAILSWEPRIQVNGLQLDPSGYLDGVLTVSLDYTLIATNSRINRIFPLYLQEGTNLKD
jgi:Bacteriophage baseplate protein W